MSRLQNYRIVIPANADVNADYAAKQLRAFLDENFGLQLELVTDSEPAVTNEICVGATNRSSARTEADQYRVFMNGSALHLVASSMYGYQAALAYTENLMKQNSISENLNYTANAADLFSGCSEYTLKKTGDVRMFFYNVYGHPNYNQELRQQMQLELIKEYDVDVVAMQEYTWHTSRKKGTFAALMQNAGYAEVPFDSSSTNKHSGNDTPLWYRTDRLEVVESGYLLYDQYNNDESKSLTWAVFRVKATGKLFLAVSTHFWYMGGEDGNLGRIYHAEKMLNVIETVRKDYPDIPVIAGGDLNSCLSDDPETILRNGGLLSAWENAQTRTNLNGGHAYASYDEQKEIYTSWGVPTKDYSSSIDQAWLNGDISVKAFITVNDFYALLASDHCPELVDFVLG